MLVLWSTAIFSLISWDVPGSITVAHIVGAQIKIEDMLFVTFALDTALRPQRLLAITRRYHPVMAIIAICLLASLIGGMIAFGPTAINEARNFFWGVGLVAWMLNQNWSDDDLQKHLRRWATFVGWAMVGVFAYHAARYGMGTADSFVEVRDGQSQTGRPLISQQCILLACLGFMMFGRTDKMKPRIFSGLVFIIVSALCQHRSVWVAIGLAVALALLKLRGGALSNTVFWGLYGSLIVSIFYVAGAFEPLVEQLTYAATSAGTYTERADSWQLLITQALNKGPGTVILGEPFGSGYERVVEGKFVTYSPHNWFVMIFLRLGLAGFLAYMLVMGWFVLPKLLRAKGMAATMILAVLAYSWTYALPWYLSPIIGWCIHEAWRGIERNDGTAPVKAPHLPTAYAGLAVTRSST